MYPQITAADLAYNGHHIAVVFAINSHFGCHVCCHLYRNNNTCHKAAWDHTATRHR